MGAALPLPAFSPPPRRRASLRTLRTYGEFVRMGFVDTLAYRLRYYTGIVTYFIYVSVYYFIWRAIYEHGAAIGGFDFPQMMTYVAVGWIIRSLYFNNIDQDLATQVTEGTLVMNLIKPVSIQGALIATALGQSAFRLAMLTLPTTLVLFVVFPVRRPASLLQFTAFSASVVLSFFIVAALNFAVGTLAIRLLSILGLLRAKYFLLELLSGLLIPISFFPRVFQLALNFLPFQYISYIPLLIYLGKLSGAAAWKALGTQAFWVLALVAVGNGMWRWSSRKITVQGG
jgi:viologen exporter family transport system permease protein